MSRRARFGRSSFFSGSSGSTLFNDRERVAAGAHGSHTFPRWYESEEDSMCRHWNERLQKSIADSEAVGDGCRSCDRYIELMSGCPGVENIKFNREGPIAKAVQKLPEKDRHCILLTQLSMRAIRDAEYIGIECKVCDSYKEKIARFGCEGYEEKIARLKEEAAAAAKSKEAFA